MHRRNLEKKSTPKTAASAMLLGLGNILAIASPEIIKSLENIETAAHVLVLIESLKIHLTPSSSNEEQIRAQMRILGNGHVLNDRYPKGLTVNILTKNPDDSGTLDTLKLSKEDISIFTQTISDLKHTTFYSKFPSITSATTSTLKSTTTSSSTSSALSSASTSSSSSSPDVNGTANALKNLRLR